MIARTAGTVPILAGVTAPFASFPVDTFPAPILGSGYVPVRSPPAASPTWTATVAAVAAEPPRATNRAREATAWRRRGRGRGMGGAGAGGGVRGGGGAASSSPPRGCPPFPERGRQ